MHLLAFVAGLIAPAATILKAQAGGLDADSHTHNTLSDIARAQREQAEFLRLIEWQQREQTRLDRWNRQNAKRNSRLVGRFDE